MTGAIGLLLTLIAVAEATAGRPAGDAAPSHRPTLQPGHCSSVALDNGGATVFGANLDHVSVNAGLVFVNQRGKVKTGLSPGTTGARAHWTSRYASATFNLVGFGYAWAGMNERGLAMSTMSLQATRCPAPNARPPLDSGEWMQFILDTCATIEEVLVVGDVEEQADVIGDEVVVAVGWATLSASLVDGVGRCRGEAQLLACCVELGLIDRGGDARARRHGRIHSRQRVW